MLKTVRTGFITCNEDRHAGSDLYTTINMSEMDLLKEIEKTISRLRQRNYSCSQATLLGICQTLGSRLSEEELLALSAGFRGGIGRSYNEGTCGALSAGIMAIGMYFPGEDERTIAQAKELFDHFRQRQGTVICGNIVQKYGFTRCTGCCLCVGVKVGELLMRENMQYRKESTVKMIQTKDVSLNKNSN